MIELTVRFDEKDFKKKEFTSDVGQPRGRKEFSYSYSPRIKSRNEHAHLFLGLDGQQSLLGLTYHPGKNPFPDIREPYLDDVAKWIGGYFKVEKLAVRFTLAFEFNKTYQSIVPLDYPLLVNNRWLKETTVVGHEINFSKEAFIQKAIISKKTQVITVLLYAGMMMEFADFDLHEAVTAFSAYATAFVKKHEDNNVTSND